MNSGFKKFILSVSCTLLFFTALAQNVSPIEDMTNAIKNNRVSDMVKYFDVIVPITINNSQSVYSRNQAEAVLRDFFEKNSTHDFSVSDNGSPDNSSKFIIGILTDAKGVKYNVYILIRLKDGNYFLQDFRLNKE